MMTDWKDDSSVVGKLRILPLTHFKIIIIISSSSSSSTVIIKNLYLSRVTIKMSEFLRRIMESCFEEVDRPLYGFW
jgi:hypothetical protein